MDNNTTPQRGRLATLIGFLVVVPLVALWVGHLAHTAQFPIKWEVFGQVVQAFLLVGAFMSIAIQTEALRHQVTALDLQRKSEIAKQQSEDQRDQLRRDSLDAQIDLVKEEKKLVAAQQSSSEALISAAKLQQHSLRRQTSELMLRSVTHVVEHIQVIIQNISVKRKGLQRQGDLRDEPARQANVSSVEHQFAKFSKHLTAALAAQTAMFQILYREFNSDDSSAVDSGPSVPDAEQQMTFTKTMDEYRTMLSSLHTDRIDWAKVEVSLPV